MAMDSSNANNISTIVIEATGGQMFGGTPTTAMKVITNNSNTNGSYPWSATVNTNITSVSISTTSASPGSGYYFNFRIETFGGTLLNINIGGTTAVTFNY